MAACYLGHLGEGKKGSTLDVTPDLVNCCSQLVHLGKRVIMGLQHILPSIPNLLLEVV